MKGVRPYTFFMHTDTRKRSKKVYIKSLKKYLHFKMFWCMIIIDERYYVNQKQIISFVEANNQRCYKGYIGRRADQ